MAKAGRVVQRTDIASRKQMLVRDEILASASQLFAERGYRAVTMGDIAESLGYTKSVVYYYFQNKNDTLWQIFNRIFESYVKDVQEIVDERLPPEVALPKMVRRHALNVMGHPHWAAIFNGSEAELEPQQRKQLGRMKRDYDAVFEAVYQAGVSLGSFREIPPHVAVSGMLGMCNWLSAWYNDKGQYSAEQIAEFYVTLLSSGFQGTSRVGVPELVASASG